MQHYFHETAVSVKRACAGQGSGNIANGRWQCNGTEMKLQFCNWTNRVCDHRRDVGVYCSGQLKSMHAFIKNYYTIRLDLYEIYRYNS